MGCEYYQELISRMLDGDLSPTEQAELSGHLSDCADCRALAQSFQTVSAALEEQLEDAPERLRANIMAELRREEIRKRNRLSRPMKIVLTTAACLVLVLGLSLGSGLLSGRGATFNAQAPATLAGAKDAALRSMPAEAAEGEAAVSAPAMEAPAPYAAGDSYAAQESLAAPVLDLSSRWTMEDLTALLGGERVPVELPQGAPVCTLLVAGDESGEGVSLYEQDGVLLYVLAEGDVYQADCDWATLQTQLNP